jgi:D-inositol-3-phosphate glycosyltransferase
MAESRGRVAVLSLHTSPLDQPGTGDSGGMNVYVRAVAGRLADLGVAVDVFTRCAGRGVPEVEELAPLFRVIQIPAGPCAPVPKGVLADFVPRFTEAVLSHPFGTRYDLVHAHYWLSGRAGLVAKERWGVPLVATFHTLGRVKDLSLGDGESAEPRHRLEGEEAVIRAADRILVPTPAEAANIHRLYDGQPGRIRLVPPGVDSTLFRPLPKEPARASLGLAGKRVVLFVGRLQPLKGPDVAIRTVAEAIRRAPGLARDVALAVVGGPSGPASGLGELRALAEHLGIGERVHFLSPRPHEELPQVYAAADVLLMPSRSESFGLVALEAQACGVPVVAAAVGGLRYVVAEGKGGFLLAGHDPAAHARRVLEVLSDPQLAARLSGAAVRHARGFPWEATASRVLSVYAELVEGIDARVAAGVSA